MTQYAAVIIFTFLNEGSESKNKINSTHLPLLLFVSILPH